MKRWTRRFSAFITSCLLAISLLPLSSLTVAAVTDWKAEGYTPISTAADLNKLVRQQLDGKFYLTGNITFSAADFEQKGAYYNDGKLWLPLGSTYAERFTGIFEGNGYTISGLKVAVSEGDSDSAYAGLFGYNAGKIRNLRLQNATVRIQGCSYGYAGGIAGAASGTLSGCYVMGGNISVSGAKVTANTGGLVGRMYAGTIAECYSSAKVNASGTMATAGGIAAQSSATINISMNHGNVTAKSPRGDASAGGIVGTNDGTLSNVLNKGAVQVDAGSDGYAGGLAGANRATIRQSVNIGAVKAVAKSHLFGGGIAGQSEGGTLSGCYYLNTTYDKAVTESSQKAVALTASQITTSGHFPALDFQSIWTIAKDAPMLRALADVQSTITGIKITQKPKKLAFVEGQKLDTTGMVVTAYYDDGAAKAVPESDYIITGYDNTTPGKKTLTVSYAGYTDTLSVTVAQKVLTGIRIQTLPNRLVYGLGEKLDLTGGIVGATYDNGSTINYTMTDSMVSGYNKDKLGKQTLTVTFHGKKATFVITMQKDPPPTTAATGTTSSVFSDATGSGEDDPFDDNNDNNGGDILPVTTRTPGQTAAKPPVSIWVALILVLVSVLAAASVVLFGLKRDGKLALHIEARHGKPHVLDQSPTANNPTDSDEEQTPPEL